MYTAEYISRKWITCVVRGQGAEDDIVVDLENTRIGSETCTCADLHCRASSMFRIRVMFCVKTITSSLRAYNK